MRQETKPAAEVRAGDWLVEGDGAALEIRRVQRGSDFVILHFTPLGTMPVQPLKVEKTKMLSVMVPVP